MIRLTARCLVVALFVESVCILASLAEAFLCGGINA